MLETMQREISENLKKINETGKAVTQDIEEVVENAVFKATQNVKDGATEINSIAKNAVTTAVNELKKSGNAEKAHIDAVIKGVVNGVQKTTKESIDDMDMEMLKTKYRIQEKNSELLGKLKDALDGTKEAAEAFTDESKEHIEEAATDIKLKSAKMLGLMESTIKQSVKTVIEEGSEVEEKISHITQEAVENALNETRLSAQKVKDVSKRAIMASIEAARESDDKVKETARGAIDGTKKAILVKIQEAKVDIQKAKENTKTFVEEDVLQTKEDLEAIDDAFTDTLDAIFQNIYELNDSQITQIHAMSKLIYSEAFDLDFQLRNIFAAATIESGENNLELVNLKIKDFLEEISIYDFDPKFPKKASPITGKAELEEDGGNLSIILKNIIENKEKRRKLLNFVKDLLPFVENLNVEKFADKSLLFKLKESYFKNQYLPATLISDGTINITALIIALYFEGKPLAIIEEPERNIHPYLMSKVVDMMKDASQKKQIIVTTHNPEMVKHTDLKNILLVLRDKEGFSTISRPGDKDEVKTFLRNEIGIEELYVQDLLGV